LDRFDVIHVKKTRRAVNLRPRLRLQYRQFRATGLFV
jgi:hypothetical protein